MFYMLLGLLDGGASSQFPLSDMLTSLDMLGLDLISMGLMLNVRDLRM